MAGSMRASKADHMIFSELCTSISQFLDVVSGFMTNLQWVFGQLISVGGATIHDRALKTMDEKL